jgi:alpha-N-arabinofuranosidase
MRRTHLAWFGLAVLLLGWLPVRGAAGQSESGPANALPNASFEEQSGGQPVAWRTGVWSGEGTFAYADVGRTGKRSLLITADQGADVGWSTTVSVEPHATYRLSGWIKTDNVRPVADRGGRGALLNLHNIQPLATPALTGTQDWTRVELVFETGGNDAVVVNCLLGGWGLATGKAWYDDLCLELVASQDWKPTVVINANQKGQPISKYIYGQFIEHLGRCIYGGIWAEMLEDRKFYHPITPEYAPYGPAGAANSPLPVVTASPWQVTGGPDTVTMDNDAPFVGQHSPRIREGSGIQQNDLALVNGKKYLGYVWIKAAGSGQGVVKVTLKGAEGAWSYPCDGEQYVKQSFEFLATETTDHASLAINVDQHPCYVGTVSLMPADNVEGMRADTLEVLKQLNSPVYRWPGGNFVSGYDWKDGIGDRDRRPPRKNPAWTGVEHNDFGLDEFMTFCRILDTEPYIALNSGLGKVDSAVEELQYATGAADTPMGAWRAKNGHAQPYQVTWWSIGNEMYGNWQLGHMPLEEYVRKHNEFAAALRAENKSIKLVAVGDAGPWSEGMMQNCADSMDLISEHFYRQERPGLASHVAQMAEAVRGKAEAHRAYRDRFESLRGKDIDIALDEWNYWYGPHVFGELGTRYFLKDALGIAGGLHEYTRQSDIMFMANYAQTVNVIGCVKTSKTHASLETTGLVLQLYREHYGSVPLSVTTQSPLDVAAALTEDGRTLTIGVVNPTMHALDLPLELQGVSLQGKGRLWQIAGSDPLAYNEPGQPPRVSIQEAEVAGPVSQLHVEPCSVTLFALPLKERMTNDE